MTLEHVAIWTNKLEVLKDFYQNFLEGNPMLNTGTNPLNLKASF